MELLLIGLAIIYMLSSLCFFSTWLEFVKADTSLTPKDRLSSVAVVVVATVFWPIVVPIAYWSLLKAKEV